MTSSAKRTLTGLVFNLAFLAALMNADFGDFWRERIERKKQRIKGQSLSLEMSHVGFCFLFLLAPHSSRTCSLLENSADAIKGAL